MDKKKTTYYVSWVVLLALMILVMVTFRFLLVALLFYAIIQFAQSKRRPIVIRPERTTTFAETEGGFRQPLFQNMLFGRQKTPEHAYEWSDVNIQTGIGDTVIDLSYAVVPKGEAVVVVRGWIGNVHIFVPYEMEVSVVHSVLFGAASIFSKETERLWNQTFIYQTPAYETAEQKLKIITSMAIGNVEVKRI